MWMTEQGWQRYHEVICSPGVPWKCAKQCALFKMFENQKQQSVPVEETWLNIERKP